jgi:antitoxin PrlF
MPSSTLTTKGQVTIPKPIRKVLRVEPGDAVEFVVDAHGRVEVRAGTNDIADLKGILQRHGRKPVSLAAMNDAIRAGRRRGA